VPFGGTGYEKSVMTAAAFSDSHIHLAQTEPPEIFGPVCAAAHSREEFSRLESLAALPRAFPVRLSFGLHPQAPDMAHAPFLEEALRLNKIAAVGETGFDAFTPEYRAALPLQKAAWDAQLALAARYGVPAVIHCRKALALIFADCAALKKLPACVFHSFAGSPAEARAFLKRGVNAWFSFGKPLLNNNKRALACAASLALDRILLETDAPFQRLKGERATAARDILRVHEAFAALRGIPAEEAARAVAANFGQVYGAPDTAASKQ